MISRAIADNGLPLKIQTEWTEDVYTNQDIDGNISTVEVDGWLIRINGKKYPVKMNYVLGDGTRQTEKNKIVAITKKELK